MTTSLSIGVSILVLLLSGFGAVSAQETGTFQVAGNDARFLVPVDRYAHGRGYDRDDRRYERHDRHYHRKYYRKYHRRPYYDKGYYYAPPPPRYYYPRPGIYFYWGYPFDYR